MPKFAYEALDPRGKLVAGVLHAENVEAAIDHLRTNKFTVTTVKQTSDIFGSIRRVYTAMRDAVPIKTYAVVIFTRQLATIFNSGIPLLRGLESLGQQALDARLGVVVQNVFNDVRNGSSLSKAMALHPKAFSPVYLALVRAGESSGALGEILNRMASLAERDYTLQRRVQASMTYPIFVFLCALASTWLIVSYVFPKFVTLIEGLNLELPLPTRILIAITHLTSNPIFLSGSVALACFGAILARAWLRTPEGKYSLDSTLLRMPALGGVHRRVALSQFCRTLGTLLASGVPVLQSIEIVSHVAGNEVIRRASMEVREAIKDGSKLSSPMRELDIFPPMMFHMVVVGEETGALSSILDRLAYFYDLEVEALLNVFASLVEPVMITVMGLMVCFVVLAVFLPVYSIMGSFR